MMTCATGDADRCELQAQTVAFNRAMRRGTSASTVSALARHDQSWLMPRLHQLIPGCPIGAVRVDGLSAKRSHSGRHRIGRTKTRWPFCPRSEWVGSANGVGQTAGGVHHGNGAVDQAVKLIQSARFEATWHQEHVAAGFNPVSHPVGELQPDGNPLGKRSRQSLQSFLVFSLARSRVPPIARFRDPPSVAMISRIRSSPFCSASRPRHRPVAFRWPSAGRVLPARRLAGRLAGFPSRSRHRLASRCGSVAGFHCA